MSSLHRLILRSCFGLALVASSASLAATTDDPNILIIYTDDQGYGDVSCLNPESKFQTPKIDQLVKEGLNFTHAHSAGSACTPSRHSLMTGRYPWRTTLKSGVGKADEPSMIAEDRLTIGTMLQQAGYHVGNHHKFQKRHLIEETTRVPFIVSVPWLRAQHGNQSAKITELIDLYPTLTELSGLTAPKDHQGTSLAPLLKDDNLSSAAKHH